MFPRLAQLQARWRALSLPEKLAAACVLFVLLSVLALESFVALKYGQAIGSDVHYHLQHSFRYASGHPAFLDWDLAAPNGGPYPPLFHLLFVPFVWLGLHAPFSALLEATALFLAFSATLLLAKEQKGLVPAAFAMALLFSSRAFFDRVQVTPQAIDAIAMPLAVLFFFRKDYKPFVLSVLAMVYSHGAYGLLLFAPFALFSLFEKRDRKANAAAVSKAALFSLPVVLLTLAFLPTLLDSGFTAVHNPQDQAIRQDPALFINYFGVGLSLFAPVSLIYFSRKLGDPFCRFLLLWLVCLLPLVIFFPDRLASYAAQPTAIMGGIALAGISKANRGAPVFFFLALLSLAFLQNYWMWASLAMQGKLITLPLVPSY